MTGLFQQRHLRMFLRHNHHDQKAPGDSLEPPTPCSTHTATMGCTPFTDYLTARHRRLESLLDSALATLSLIHDAASPAAPPTFTRHSQPPAPCPIVAPRAPLRRRSPLARKSHVLYHFDRVFTPCYALRQVFIFSVFKTRSEVLLTPKVFILFRSVHFDLKSRMEPEKLMSTRFILCLGAWTARQDVTTDFIGQSTTTIVPHR